MSEPCSDAPAAASPAACFSEFGSPVGRPQPAIRSGRLAAEAVVALFRDGVPLDDYARRVVAIYGPGERSWFGRQTARLPDATSDFVFTGLKTITFPA